MNKNLVISICQKRIEPLVRFRDALGQGGKIHTRTSDGIFVYNIYARRKVLTAFDLMWAFLSPPKVEQALGAGYIPKEERQETDPLEGYYELLVQKAAYDEAVA